MTKQVNIIQAEPRVYLEDKRQRGWFWDCNEIFESDLSSSAILVRLYLARCANGDRQAWPSLNTIARHCRISKPTVIKALRELEEKGWLDKIIRRRPNQEYETTVYVLKDPPARVVSDSEGGSKADLPPVKNKTSEAGGVVKQIYHPVKEVDNLVKQVDPNNTQITIPMIMSHELFVSSLRSDTNNSASALQAACAVDGGTSGKGKCDSECDSHPQAGAADAAGKGEKRGKVSKTEADKLPTSKELIAELVKEYRAVEGVAEAKGDYSFIGALYNKFGYDRVLEAIYELSLATAVQKIQKPLLYLKAILSGGDRKSAGEKCVRCERSAPDLSAGNWSRTMSPEEKRRLIQSLYLS
jgi:DNA-binding MarR family transcriptional regulator